jgi:hypothetical protein
MSKLLGNVTPSPEALAAMRERNRLGAQWAAFQNHALDSANLGGLRFLQIGDGCTFATPPERYPDTKFGTGWRHLLVGFVNLETGEIVEAL